MQETFDEVVNGLRKQGGKSISKSPHGEICAYRGAEGRKCAAGLLMKDEEYDPAFEGQNIRAIMLRYPSVMSLYRDNSVKGLIFHLQQIHDWHKVLDWESLFQALAMQYNLVYTPLQ
jgi:hypothetical protein